MDATLRPRAEPLGLRGLLLSLFGFAILGCLYFALLAGLTALVDWALHGADHLENLLVTAQSAARKGEQRSLEMTGMVFGSFIYLSAIAALVSLAWLRARRAWRDLLAWRPFRPDGRYWLLVAAGILYGFLASLLVEHLHPQARDWFTLPKAPVAVLTSLMLVVVLAPVAEELFFRGWCYTALRHRLGFSAAWVLTSFAFALAHWERTGLYAAVVLPIGLVLGWLRERSDSARATALFHALYNLSGWLLTYFLT